MTDQDIEAIITALHQVDPSKILMALQHLQDYKTVLVDAAVVNWTLTADESPKKILADLLDNAERQALDPAISTRALRLLAIGVAHAAHARQRSKYDNRPYIDHVSRVAGRLTGEAEIVGWLHDVVEDTDVGYDDLVAMGFPPSIMEALRLVTHDSEISYEEYIHRIGQSVNPIAIAVKIADLTDNLRESAPESLRKRYEPALAQLQLIAVTQMQYTAPHATLPTSS